MTRVYYKEGNLHGRIITWKSGFNYYILQNTKAQGCIIMFDLTSRSSFENAVKWKKDVDSKCVLEDGAPVPCMLLANKVVTRDYSNRSGGYASTNRVLLFNSTNSAT